MRHAVSLVALALLLVVSARADAQEEAPPIGPYVIDVHGNVPLFPGNDQQLADSRGLNLSELPGRGLGINIGAHVYVFRWRAITFGLGGEAIIARSHFTPSAGQTEPAADTPPRPATERFVSAAPQLSFNFGTGRGWSYLSGGIGASQWSIHRDALAPSAADTERLKTINYGGGARWFAKRHLAFSLDVRFYALDPGTPQSARPGGPRTTLMVIGAGVSVK